MPTRSRPREVVIVDDPDDAPSTQTLLAGLNNIDAGVLVIHPVPGSTGLGGLGLAVLAALGKLLGISQNSQRATERTWRLARAWTVGHAPDIIVVDRAHRLPATVLAGVLALAAEAGAVAWLVDPAGRCPARLPATTRTTTVAPGQLATLRRPPPPPPAPVEFPELLPTADFLTFRAVCARRLNPRAAALVDAAYQQAFTHFMGLGVRRNGGHSDHRALAWDLPHELTRELAAHCSRSVNAGEALVRLRAAQAGLLRAGFLLRHIASLDALTPATHLLCPLTPTIADTLRTLVSTTHAAAAALQLLMPFDALYRTVTYTLDEIPDDASYLGASPHRSIPVPECARPILLAHAAWVRQSPAPTDRFHHPLFGDERIDDLAPPILARLPVPAHLVPAHPTRHYTGGANASTWMTQRGLSVESVTTHLPGLTPEPWLQGISE